MPSFVVALRFAVVVLLGAASPALAQRSCARVSVAFEGEGWSASWASGVHPEVSTEIEVAGLCEASGEEPADAQIVMRFDSKTVVEMEVSAGDSSTRRSVQRKLDLEPLPMGQWAFAVGVSASELLREAREVIPVLRVPEAPEPERPWSVSLRANGLFSGGGISFFGVDLSVRKTFDRFVLELAGVISWPPTRSVEVGRVSGVAPGGSVMLGGVLVSQRVVSLDLGALLDVRAVTMTGVASTDEFAGHTASTVVISGLAVTTLWLTTGHFVASLRVGIGGVVRGLTAQVGGAENGGYTGVAGLAALGVGARW